MSNLETNGSPQLELVRSFYIGIEKRDMAQCAKTMHEDHRHLTHPRCIGKPVQNKREYLENMGELAGLWTEDCEASCVSHVPVFPLVKSLYSLFSILSPKLRGRWSSTFVYRFLACAAPLDVDSAPQLTGRASTSLGFEMNREMIWIGHIVTDDDGSLKLKKVEEFADSKTYLELYKAVAEARANRERSSA